MDKEVAMEMDKEVDNEEWVIQGGRVAIVWVVGGWKSEEGNVGVSDQDWLQSMADIKFWYRGYRCEDIHSRKLMREKILNISIQGAAVCTLYVPD